MGLTHGGFVGTPAFASPEQFTNAQVEVRSSIYSLGATLWYLLTGNRPFQGTNHRTDSREPALASSADRTAEGSPAFQARLVSLLVLIPTREAQPSGRVSVHSRCNCRIAAHRFSTVGKRRADWLLRLV